MNTTTRKRILRVNAAILGLFGAISFFMLDVRGVWFDSGPQTAVLRSALSDRDENCRNGAMTGAVSSCLSSPFLTTKIARRDA
jgi:hypothetical protein